MKRYITADPHYGHANIMKHCGRTLFMTKSDLIEYNRVIKLSEAEQKKFKLSKESLNRMNQGMIKRHNERVKPGDIVYMVGDFCFKNTAGGKKGEGILVTAKEWKQKLNGKFIFIRGNHDRNNTCK
ncbi:hypothetical protein LCGC14_2219840, partial [marine sediment metagenome]